jgi:hypothetical protein
LTRIRLLDELPSAGAVTQDDQFVIYQGGRTRVAQIAGLIAGVTATALLTLQPSIDAALAGVTGKLDRVALVPTDGLLTLTTSAGAVTGVNNKYTYSGIYVSDDQVSQVAGGIRGPKVDGFYLLHEFGGPFAQGGRHAIESVLIHKAATSASNADRNYVGGQSQVQSLVGDGGTSASDLRGQYFGGSWSCVLQPGAKFVYNACGGELNTVLFSGCSVGIHAGVQIADTMQVRGSLIDTAVMISCTQGSTTTFQNAFFIGAPNGAPALGADSTLMYIDGNAIPVIKFGLNFQSVVVTDALISAPATQLQDGALTLAKAGASLVLGNAVTSNTPRLDFRSGGNVGSAYDVRLLASGGSGTAGNGVLTVVSSLLIPPTLTRPGSQFGSSLGAPGFEFNTIHTQSLVIQALPTSAPTVPGQVTFASPSNTSVVISKMGSDNTVRSFSLTLA